MSTAESSKEPLAPIWVGLAIWLFFPLGLFLLWKHPTLGKNGKWWAAGIAWACFLVFMSRNDEPSVDGTPAVTTGTSGQSTASDSSRETHDPDEDSSDDAEDSARSAETAAREVPSKTESRRKDEPPPVGDAREVVTQATRVERKWFESDDAYVDRGIRAIAPSALKANVTSCTLAPAKKPWEGYAGTINLDDNTMRKVEIHPFRNDFVVVFYTWSRWLGYPAEFFDSSGRPVSADEFCKRAYGKTTEQIEKIYEAEADKHVTAQALWNISRNEAALRRRFPGRFTVEGTVFEVRQEYGTWRVRLFVGRNPRGIDRWVECTMRDNKGLDAVHQGSVITVEGEFSKMNSAGPEMAKCSLVE